MAGLRHGPLWPFADEIIPILAGVNDGPMAASGPLTVPRSGGPPIRGRLTRCESASNLDPRRGSRKPLTDRNF
jgi:hypothetical protein